MKRCQCLFLIWTCISLGELESQSLELIGQLNYVNTFGTDVSEYIDTLNKKTYVVAGELGAFHIIEVTDPSNPELISTVNGSGFDVKTWSHYVYSVGSQNGGTITDISDPGKPIQVGGFPSAHNHYIDGSGLLYNSDGIVFDLTLSPDTPIVKGSLNGPNWSHDITTQGRRVLSCEGTFGTSVFELDSQGQSVLLMQFRDEPIGYHHQGDFTVDGNYLIVGDEAGTSTDPDIIIWDISDTDNPELVKTLSDEQALCHNLYVRDNFLYVAYYTAGLKVYDIVDPRNPILIDTYKTNSNLGESFQGAFGILPSKNSELIYVTDSDNGLFIFRLNENSTPVDNHPSPPPIFKVYPNPAQDLLYVDLPFTEDHEGLVVAFDLSGRKFKLASVGTARKVFTIDYLPQGLYQLTMPFGGQLLTQSFVKIDHR